MKLEALHNALSYASFDNYMYVCSSILKLCIGVCLKWDTVYNCNKNFYMVD